MLAGGYAAVEYLFATRRKNGQMWAELTYHPLLHSCIGIPRNVSREENAHKAARVKLQGRKPPKAPKA